MNNIIDFITASFPWVMLSLGLAVFSALTDREDGK